MVGRVARRLSELRKQLDETSSELVAKQHTREALRDFLHITQAENEIKVLKRKCSGLKIKIKNLEGGAGGSGSRKLSRASISTVTEFLEADDGSDVAYGDVSHDYDVIDFEDEYFNPEEMKKEKHVRPRPEYPPTNSLPHSKPRFKHTKRIGLLRDVSSEPRGLNLGLVDITGQFRSVEDEETDWSSMTLGGQKEPSGKRNRKFRYRLALNPEISVIKPKVENLVGKRKESIVQVLRKLSVADELTNEMTTGELSRDCICKRAPSRVVCSGHLRTRTGSSECDYSFTGRVASPCDLHPGDNYLMDHPPKCPRCDGNLVEAESSKESVSKDWKPMIVTPVLTSTPKDKKARSRRVQENATEE